MGNTRQPLNAARVAQQRLEQIGMSKIGIAQVLAGQMITDASDRKLAAQIVLRAANDFAPRAPGASRGTSGIDFVNFAY